MKKWYEKSGAEGDAVISTRIRLARNLRTHPFPGKLNPAGRAAVEQIVKEAVLACVQTLPEQFHFVEMAQLSQTEAVSLVERHLVSPEFIADRRGRGLILTDDESISIMINEEDHLRIQVMREGFGLKEAFRTADRLDSLLNSRLEFAFDERLGYLTQCPTNLGTGMRASLMLHLPALQESGMMSRYGTNLTKLGIALRGLYGEGSKPAGAVYQLSNQVTLGLSEQEAIANLESIAMQIIAQERSARSAMVKSLEMQDAISRSLGILRSAKLLSNEEFMKLISNVRLGVSTALIRTVRYDTVNQLMVEVQPATVSLASGGQLAAGERDAVRAKIVSQRLTRKEDPDDVSV